MSFTRAIYLGGVETVATADGWRLVTADCRFDVPAAVLTSMPYRGPVLVMGTGSPPLWLLTNQRTGRALEVENTELMTRPLDGRSLFEIRNLNYHLGAAIYHCKRLALAYAELCSSADRLSKIPGAADMNRFIHQGADDAYYEFDACVTAARRVYDVLKFPLWKFFNSRHPGHPPGLEHVLQRADQLRPALKAAIEKSWQSWGMKAREYRDSIAHWVPIEFGLGSADMLRLECGAWRALIRIPDNPIARSRQKFTYTQGFDALTFCHELVAEVSGLLQLIVRHIAPGPNDPVTSTP
jgi:hypothetical protein